ncbi:MAG: alkaline phosphatase [Kangiellaceae bacterium]|jgi:alkaline phosphatase|nr:alkaline phosphatase [Kangiellaceae bacterium]
MNYFKLSAVALAVAGLASCSDDGTNGIDGVDGIVSLVNQTELAVGDANCRNGGIQVDSGLDSNNNQTLDASEVTETEFLCNAPISQLSANDVLNNSNNAWYIASAQSVEQSETNLAEVIKARGSAKNIILFVGDGMGASTVTAARILEGQQKGMMGEENQLSFGAMPFSGLAKTYNVDAQTPDSAGTMTAMVTGVKTDVGVIGIDEDVVRGDCTTVAGNELVSALELAEIAGLSTGVISTARITHATPAATYAKSADRNWEDISDMPADAITAGCTDIADQLVNFEANLEARFAGVDIDGIEVVMGGGRRHFLPRDAAFNSPDAQSSVEGDRTDNRDLTAEWQATYPTGQYIFDQAGFDAIDPAANQKVFALFNESHMQYEADRANDIAGEPSIGEMTEKAIDILDNNSKGFFLTVESGRIDHGHHAGSAYNALTDTIAFSDAIRVAMQNTNPQDTLIIVTADHGHVFTIGGYPKRGNPILGKVVSVGNTEPSLAADDLPYTTVGYTNGRGFRDLGSETNADATYASASVAGRIDLTAVDTQSSGFHQEATVPLSSETHSGEDVGVYAQGPLAQLVNGTNEQSFIFHVMEYAGDLTGKANQQLP